MTIARDEFRRGWRPLVASSLGIAFGISPIPFFAIGHLTPELEADFGWSRAQIMLAVTVVGVTNALTTPLYGALMDRWGVRPVALGSLVGFALTWALVSRSTGSLVLFYATWLLMALAGSASQPISWTRVVNAWFSRSRGFALGLALTGTGIAGFAINALLPRAIDAFGWRGAILVTLVLPLGVALPVAIAWFREPRVTTAGDGSAPAPAATGVRAADALRTARFWTMAAIFVGFALAYAGLSTNFVPLLIDAGWLAPAAGLTVGTIGISTVAGRVIAGYLFDHFRASRVAAPLLAGPVATCFLLSGETVSPGAALAGAVLLGLAAGMEADLIAYLTARWFGLRSYGTLYGILFGGFGLGAAVSPPLYGWVRDASGSYDFALWAAAGLFAAGAVAMLLLGRHPDDERLPTPVAAAAAGDSR